MSAADISYPHALLLVTILAGVAGGVWLLSDGPATDARQPETIDACTEITAAGHYGLTRNITESEADTCIRIRSDDVVLHGNGHRIEGTGAFGTAGVVARPSRDGPLRNVTVRDVTVTDWDDGIRYVEVANGSIVETATANNRVGVSLLNARDNRLANNTARANRLRGISLLEDSTDNALVNNTAADNALFGIHLVEGGVRNNTLRSNTASNNEFGIALIGVRDNLVIENAATENRIAGIWLSAASDNRIARNSVSNRFYGIFLADRSDGNDIANNVAESNAVGVRLRSSDENAIRDNEIRASTDNGILLISSDGNEITGNTGSNNERGISVVRSTGNALSNNTLGA